MKRKLILSLLALTLVLSGCSAANTTRLAYIGAASAKAAAVEAAGIQASQATFTGVDMSTREGLDYYQVEFTANGRTYRYYIDALTGAVIEAQGALADAAVPGTDDAAAGSQTTQATQGGVVTNEPDPAPQQIPTRPAPQVQESTGEKTQISAQEAMAIALAHAGLTEEQVVFVKSGLDWDDGRRVYDLEFYTADQQEFDYDIDPYTGAILSFDHDAEYHTPPAPAPEPTPDPTPAPTPVPAPDTGSSAAVETAITAEKAKAIALAHAGLTEDQVVFVKSEIDRDDGRRVYELEFYTADRREFDYEIDLYTGAVLSFDHDAEDYDYVPPASGSSTGSGTITAEQAKAIALAQVPGATADNIREFEVDYDDGRLEYEGKIYYGHLEYEFEIDGYSGAIRSWEVESIYDD